MDQREVFYEIWVPGRGELFDTSDGAYATRKEALAHLRKVRRTHLPDAFLAKVTYERCPEPVRNKQ